MCYKFEPHALQLSRKQCDYSFDYAPIFTSYEKI
jgi:hypothetical protein